MVVERKTEYIECGRCQERTMLRDSYQYEGKLLCVRCYRNETRRGIDDVITKRRRVNIPKV